jgi:hypothetical protein
MAGELPFPALERPAADADSRREALLFCAAFSVVAGTIHAVAAAQHFPEVWWYGALFAALAAFQLAWAFRAYPDGSPLLLRLAIPVSLGVIATWLVSRTVGMPFGPQAFEPERVGALDLAATLDELVLVGLLVAIGRGRTSIVLTAAGRLAAYTVLTLTALTLFLAGHAH